MQIKAHLPSAPRHPVTPPSKSFGGPSNSSLPLLALEGTVTMSQVISSEGNEAERWVGDHGGGGGGAPPLRRTSHTAEPLPESRVLTHGVPRHAHHGRRDHITCITERQQAA